MADRIVHIGFPKTATTYLQREIFPNLKAINYVNYDICRVLFPEIVTIDRLDQDLVRFKEQMLAYEEDDKVNLYSFESLAGSPYAMKGVNRSAIAKTLKELGFDKVIITVRDQVKAIDSYYRQYVVHGGTLRFRQWLDIDNERPWMHKHFSLSYLRYDLLVSHYQQLFGVSNVLVIDSANFKSAKDTFVPILSEFVGSEGIVSVGRDDKKTNDSLSNLSTSLLRFCNYFTYNTIRPSQLIHKSISTRNVWLLLRIVLDPYLLRLFSGSGSYVKKFRLSDRLRNYYKTSNLELQKLTGIKYYE